MRVITNLFIFKNFFMIKRLIFLLKFIIYNYLFFRRCNIKIVSFTAIEKNYNNLNIILNNLKKILRLYPNNHILYFTLGNFSYGLGLPDYLKNYNQSESIRQKLIKKFYLKDLNYEFMPSFGFNGSFGNILWVYYWFLAKELNFVEKKQTFVLLNKGEKIKNIDLYKYFKDSLTIKNNNYFNRSLSYFLTVPMGHYFPLRNNNNSSIYESMNIINSYSIKNNFNRVCNIFESDNNHGLDTLEKLKIPKSAWYVLLHVRDGSTYNDFTRQTHRNANINDYIISIESIIKKGGYVIRVGDSNMPKLPKIKNLIDYAHSKYKSQKMDIFLAATCKFLIGTSSGFWALNHMFGTPVLMTNCLFTHNYFALNNTDLYLPRILKNTDGKVKDFSTHFDLPNSIALSDVEGNLKQKGLFWENNNELDILNAVDEMCNRVIYKKISKNLNLERDYKAKIKQLSIKYNNTELNPLADIPEFFLQKFKEFEIHKIE